MLLHFHHLTSINCNSKWGDFKRYPPFTYMKYQNKFSGLVSFLCISFVWNSEHIVEEFYCSNFFQTFENEFCAVKTMKNISQGRQSLFSDSPHEHGYTNSHGHCRQNIQPKWIVLSSAFQNWNMYLLTLIPKTIVTRLSSWLIGRGKKRQHRLLSPLHLENCTWKEICRRCADTCVFKWQS